MTTTASRLLAVCLLLAPMALAAALPAQAQPQPVLKDKVLAVVDEDPILASDVERVIRLGLEQPRQGEADPIFRRRVLDGLIEERLRFHEIDRFGFEQVPVEEIDEHLQRIRQRFPSEDAFRKALKEAGLDTKGLRQLVARQLLVLTYVDERLGIGVFVTPDDIQKYYRSELTAEMQRNRQPVPPLDDVREQIREVLKQRKLNQELETWTNELRTKADVVIHSSSSADRPLPPVVKRIEKKAEAKKP